MGSPWGAEGMLNHSYLYCMDTELGWGNRSYFTFFSQLNRGSSSSLWAILESSILILLFILSTVANVLIFYTLSSNRRLRTVTNYFVCNLTLADVCFTLSCPLVAVVRVTGTWVLGSFACKTIVYLSCVCGFVTIWTLTLISLDRYSCIVRSSKHRLTPTMALTLIAVVWVVTLAAFTPLLLYFVVKECPNGTGVVSICTLGWPRTPGVSVPVLFTSIVCGVGFIVPIFILIVSHVCILIKVHKVRAAMQRQRQRHISSSSVLLTPTLIPAAPSAFAYPPLTRPTTPPSCSGSGGEGGDARLSKLFLPALLPKSAPRLKTLTPGSLSATTATLPSSTVFPTAGTSTLDARKRRSSRELQVVKTLVFLVLLFLVMWAPIFVVFVLIMKDAHDDVMQVSSQAFLGAMCVAYLNAVLNPLAYGLSTDKLRQYLRAWFQACVLCRGGCCCCCCCRSAALSSGLSGGIGEGRRGGACGGSTGGGGGGGDGEDRRARLVGGIVKSSGGTSMS